MLSWGLLALTWGVAVILGLGSCLSPTLPLPPPADPEIEPVGQGTYQLSGTVPEADALVIARNFETGQLAGDTSNARGEYSFSIAAQVGDYLELWYDAGQDSQHHGFVIPPPATPPMSPPRVSAPVSGVVTLSGTLPHALAEVVAENESTGEQVRVASDGDANYALEIAAESGDSIVLYYRYGLDESDRLTVEVP